MRIAIVSDIHSNIHALRTVLDEVWRVGDVDRLVCAGDTVGYGAFPNECCVAMIERSKLTVLGNHDRTALDGDTYSMNPYAAEAAIWTGARLNDRSRKWLQSLPAQARLSAEGRNIALFHGSVRSVDEYVFEDHADESLLPEARCEVLVLGHTHVPYVKRFRSGIIINPGSVGQPRDGDPRASFAMMDTTTLHCEVVRLKYDVDAAAAGIRQAGLPRLLADRLLVGR